MSTVTIILVYTIIWWMVFFAALPFGVRAQNEEDGDIVDGTVPSAPVNPNLLKKALWTSLIAAVLTLIYYFCCSEWVSGPTRCYSAHLETCTQQGISKPKAKKQGIRLALRIETRNRGSTLVRWALPLYNARCPP